MTILYLSRSDSGVPHPFIKEQANALIRNYNLDIQHFLITSGGIRGYYKAILRLHQFINKKKIQIVHVHYGLWAMVAVLVKYICFKKFEIVITYHGSDIFKPSERKVSLIGARFAAKNILVSERMRRYF